MDMFFFGMLKPLIFSKPHHNVMLNDDTKLDISSQKELVKFYDSEIQM